MAKNLLGKGNFFLHKRFKPERDICSLLITRIPFNRFSHCEDSFIFMCIYLNITIIYIKQELCFLLELLLFTQILYGFFLELFFGTHHLLGDTLLNICHGHQLTMVTRGKGM